MANVFGLPVRTERAQACVEMELFAILRAETESSIAQNHVHDADGPRQRKRGHGKTQCRVRSIAMRTGQVTK